MKHEFKIENAVIHLIGAPGTGKYTIASEMTRLADIRLVDNHLINNPLFSLIRQDGMTKLPPRVWQNVRMIWSAVADTMVHICPPEFSFVLTNALFENDADDLRHMRNMRNVAQQRKGLYVPVRLLISDADEHRRRITSPSREQRMKETDLAAAARYAGKEILKTGLPEELTLDVAGISAVDAARRILSHAAKLR